MISVKQSQVMEQKEAEGVFCTENVSYGEVTAVKKCLDQEVDKEEETIITYRTPFLHLYPLEEASE